MSGDLRVLNRQRARPLDLPLFRRIIGVLLAELLEQPDFDLTVHIVNTTAMAQLNQKHLGHEGSTDVITLDYGEKEVLAGELFVCVDEALIQAKKFRVPWTMELVRYAVHGVLHLCGHDDQSAAARLRMKRAENRLVGELTRRFGLSRLARKRKVAA